MLLDFADSSWRESLYGISAQEKAERNFMLKRLKAAGLSVRQMTEPTLMWNCSKKSTEEKYPFCPTQIWELMIRIVEERRMGLIVVTHDEALAQEVCTRIVSLPELNKL